MKKKEIIPLVLQVVLIVLYGLFGEISAPNIEAVDYN